MKHPNRRLAFALGLFAAVSAATAQAQTPPPPSGRTLAATCSGCHGPSGRSAGEIPSIFGRTEAQIVQAMQEFKTDRRPATVMNRHAKGFSDDEIVALAKEISANWR